MHICNVHYVQCNVHYVQFAMSALSMSPPLKTQSMHHFPAKKKTSPYICNVHSCTLCSFTSSKSNTVQ